MVTPGVPSILFDSRSSQVLVNYQTGTRLTDLYSDLKTNYGWPYDFTPIPSVPGGEAPAINTEMLQDYNVLCILTRLDQNAPPSPKAGAPYPPGTNTPPYYPIFAQDSFQYGAQEVADIQNWVAQGNGLLLISDHGPMATNITDNQTLNDSQLAAAFGVVLAPANFYNPVAGEIIEMSGSYLNTAAFSSNILQSVTNIVVHDCGAIYPMQPSNDSIQTIASLPPGLKNASPINNFSPDGLSFAVLVGWGKGNVIIAGNSGMTGNPNHPYPAQGLYYSVDTPPGPQAMPYAGPCQPSYLPAANNATFILNCLGFLGGYNFGTN